MKNKPFVSILIVTYNHERYIAKSIQSVLDQDIKYPYEILIGEDLSTDNTRDIVKEYHRKYPNIIKVEYNEKNLGAFDNFNNILPKAKGKYVAILDGDDYWINKNKLKMQIEYLEKHPKCVISHTKSFVIDDNDNILNYTFPSKKPKIISNIKDQLKRNVISNLTCVFRNDLINKLPSFVKKYYATDWIHYVLLSQYGTIDYISIPTTAYRRNPNNVSNNTSEIEKIKSKIKAYHDIDSYLKFTYKLYINKLIRREKSKFYALLSFQNGLKNNRVKALKYLIKSLYIYGFNIYGLNWKFLSIFIIINPKFLKFAEIINKGIIRKFIHIITHKS